MYIHELRWQVQMSAQEAKQNTASLNHRLTVGESFYL